MSRTYVKVAIIIAMTVVLAFAVPALAKKGPPPKPDEGAVNNLSFPAITLDGFNITPVTEFAFSVVYEGTFPGVDPIPEGTWYPQKVDGNTWQADFAVQDEETVDWVDWGDSIESVYPKVGTPTRLEVTLYKELAEPMLGFNMTVLEYPSSPDELQGTDSFTYPSDYATIISYEPKLVIQFMGAETDFDPATTTVTWDGDSWSSGDIVAQAFGPELNIGGKYIYGASSGGWKPKEPGYYRLTFYVPDTSGVSLADALIGNWATLFGPGTSTEPPAATPVVDGAKNLTYVDVLAKAKGGGGGGGKKH